MTRAGDVPREPVAWICNSDMEALKNSGDAVVYSHRQEWAILPPEWQTPLYTAPAPRAELTDAECNEIVRDVYQSVWGHERNFGNTFIGMTERAIFRAGYALALAPPAPAEAGPEQSAARTQASSTCRVEESDQSKGAADHNPTAPDALVARLRRYGTGSPNMLLLMREAAAALERLELERDTQRDITDREIERAESAEALADAARKALAELVACKDAGLLMAYGNDRPEAAWAAARDELEHKP